MDEDELLDGSDDLIGCSQDSDNSDLDGDDELHSVSSTERQLNIESPKKKPSITRQEIEVEKKALSDYVD